MSLSQIFFFLSKNKNSKYFLLQNTFNKSNPIYFVLSIFNFELLMRKKNFFRYSFDKKQF